MSKASIVMILVSLVLASCSRSASSPNGGAVVEKKANPGGLSIVGNQFRQLGKACEFYPIQEDFDSLEFLNMTDVLEEEGDCIYPRVKNSTLLTSVVLSDYVVDAMPVFICHLDRIQNLCFQNCRASMIRECIYSLPNLKDLRFIDMIDVDSLSWETENQSVTFLTISESQLHSLPSSIYLFPNLEYLNMEKNSISFLPSFLGEMPNLKKIWVKGNPLLENSTAKSPPSGEFSLGSFQEKFPRIKVIDDLWLGWERQ